MSRFKILLTAGFAVLLMTSLSWAVDLYQSFDSPTFPPPGWQTLQTGQGVNIWERNTTYPHSGSGSARSNYEDLEIPDVSERWLIAPKLEVDNATDSVAFWVRSLYSFVTDDDSLFIVVSTTDSLTTSFTDTLVGLKCGSGGDFINEYVRFAVSLEDYVGQNIFVAFKHVDPDDYGNTIIMDDVTGPEVLVEPDAASDPMPGDGAIAILPDTVLHWTNGYGTSLVDVYLAQTQDSVDNFNPDARKVTDQLVESYDPGGLNQNQVYYWRVVTKNAYGSNNGDVWSFTVAGTPLAGSYDIGGGANDYANFSEAIGALLGNGISASVTFNVYGGDYDERVALTAIPGASATDTVVFTDASGTARVIHSADIGVSDGVVFLDSCSYVTWDGIDIDISGDTRKCLTLKSYSTNNVFKNATFNGDGYASSVSYCAYMYLSGNDNNVFDNLHLRNAIRGFSFTGSSGDPSESNIVQNCTIDSVDLGFYVSYQNNLHIRDNDILLNASDNNESDGAWGLYVYSMSTGNTVDFYRNEVHDITYNGTGSYGCGLMRLNASGAVVNVYNNFCYDFRTAGSSAEIAGAYAGSGDLYFYFNSIRIDDVASTDKIGAFRMGSSTGSKYIQNNIFYVDELENESYGIYATSSYYPVVLDNNAYYGNAANTNYNLAKFAYSTPVYEDLAALQDATDFEDHGVEGDPGFISTTDLHIDADVGTVSNLGAQIVGIEEDIDGEERLVTPDIGADEYTYNAPAADFAVIELIGVQELYPELTAEIIPVAVQNRGSAAQTDVPVRLFWDGAQQDQELVSLDPNEVDTVYFDWTTPAAPMTAYLEAQCFLAGDIDLSNDSLMAEAMIVGVPMHDGYDIGGGNNDYADFTSAIADITLRGVDGAVTFNVYGTTYNEAIVIGVIPGVDETNTVTFLEHSALDEPVELTADAGSAVVLLEGATYITFDGIDMTATGTCQSAVRIDSDGDYNTVKNCTLMGSDLISSSDCGININGGGNDYNTFDNVDIGGAYYPVRFYGSSSSQDVGNVLKNSNIFEGRYCIYLYYQEDCKIHDNDIQPGYIGASVEVRGIYAATLSSNDTCWAWSNRIYNFRSSSITNGFYISTSSGCFVAYNNFIYGFEEVTGSGALYAMKPYGGNSELYFNSIYIGDVGTTGNIYGVYTYGSSTNILLLNNIIQVDEPTEECWAIYRSNGNLTSDYNLVYSFGPGALYNMGYDGTDYATLADWTTGTGLDVNSVESNPGYLNASDLHIQPTFEAANAAGTIIGGVSDDIDDDMRGTPPDIGADEYEFVALANEYGVNRFTDLEETYPAGTPAVIGVEFQNYGTANQTDVDVSLFYEEGLVETQQLSLLAGEIDTVYFNWTPPVVGIDFGVLEAQSFLAGDQYPNNDSLLVDVIVVGGPMSGTYDLGGGSMDFENFTEASIALVLLGINGPVTIDCYEGTYEEAITLTEISGASFTDQVTIKAHETVLDEVDNVVLTADAGGEVVLLDGTDFVTFDGINVQTTGGAVHGFTLENGATYITIKNLAITGYDSTTSSPLKYAVSLHYDANDNLTMDNLTITGFGYGLRCYEGSGSISNLEVKNCYISGANYGIYPDNADGSIHHNVIRPHGDAATSVYGIYVSSLSADDTMYVYNNDIHDIRYEGTSTSATVAGIYDASDQVTYIYNNLVYGFSVTSGSPDVYGIRVSYGEHNIYHNSILMGDGYPYDDLAGIQYTGSSGDIARIKDNIIVLEEADGTCYGLAKTSTSSTLESDYNCFYGTGTGYYVGRVSTSYYQTLPEWQGTTFDPFSVFGDPGYMSASDLHINPEVILVDGAGVAVPEVTDDFDGDPRQDPPDIGADEYSSSVPEEVVDLVIIQDVVNGDIILQWTATVGANSYDVYAGDSSDFVVEPATLIGSTGETTFTHEDILLTDAVKFYLVYASSAEPPEESISRPPSMSRRTQR